MEIQFIKKKRERNFYLVKIPICLKGKNLLPIISNLFLTIANVHISFPSTYHFQIFLTHEIIISLISKAYFKETDHQNGSFTYFISSVWSNISNTILNFIKTFLYKVLRNCLINSDINHISFKCSWSRFQMLA